MRCLKPYHSLKDNRYYPCGRCLACRIQRREDWSLRMIHELTYWKKAMFVTLTYDDEHLPVNGSLSSYDLRCFFKRLRKSAVRFYGDSFRLKYFACGEYGPRTHRPHYHAIIFGLDYSDPVDIDLVKSSWCKCAPYMWHPRKQHGRIRRAIAPVVDKCIRYVAGYVFKKAVDNSVDEWLKYASECAHVRLEPIFQRQSQGIGKRYAFDNVDYLSKYGHCKGNRPIPRYYRKLLGIRNFTNPAFQKVFEKQMKDLEDFVKIDMVHRRRWNKLNPKADTGVLVCPVGVSAIHALAVAALEETNDFDTTISAWQEFCDVHHDDVMPPVWVSNIDYDEQRLHCYSRRYNK